MLPLNEHITGCWAEQGRHIELNLFLHFIINYLMVFMKYNVIVQSHLFSRWRSKQAVQYPYLFEYVWFISFMNTDHPTHLWGTAWHFIKWTRGILNELGKQCFHLLHNSTSDPLHSFPPSFHRIHDRCEP